MDVHKPRAGHNLMQATQGEVTSDRPVHEKTMKSGFLISLASLGTADRFRRSVIESSQVIEE